MVSDIVFICNNLRRRMAIPKYRYRHHISMKKQLQNIIIFAFALFAVVIRVLDPTQLKLNYSSYEAVTAITILAVFVDCVVFRQIKTNSKYSIIEHICFVVFAFFETLNYIYFKNYSLHDLNWCMALYIACAMLINYLLAQYGYEIIKYWTQRPTVNTSQKNKSYWTYFIILIIPYTTTLLLNYPGFMMYDSAMQILQIFNIPNFLSNQAVLINPDILMTTHHPFIHTIIIKFFLWIGECCGSLSFGAFLYSLTQIVCMAAIIAYILNYIQKYITAKTLKFWTVIFAFNPIVLMYSILMTKDTIFACLFGLFAIKMYEYAKDNTVIKNKKWWVSFLSILLITSIFRNNFMYVAVITLLCLLVRHAHKKQIIALISVYLCVYFAYSAVLIPALGVSKGSIREVISVAFQQTANYAQHYELTDEETEVIEKVLDVEKIKQDYMPEVSNLVKNTFNKHATNKELVDYFVTWVKMFFKHPDAYFDAYLNQFYGYFSTRPVHTAVYTEVASEEVRARLEYSGLDISPRNNITSKIWSAFLSIFECCPILYLITNGGLYIWIIMSAIIYIAKHQQKRMIWMYVPFLLYFATLLLSPANATLEYRYLFPYLIAMPVLLLPVYNCNITEPYAATPT